ncbi:hypothetical protein DPMN_081440 [Dreissena polymorpha]|uniref:Endonuclease/exonuclease/phosphatase domain-containing protein n=1 Tax=Dreissena polymorpha TaxID=45954 RepID=A0A9D3Y830_DREPO|nr:hypothetical protein DPMN_081440 [Dreissena polymorpha]
MNTEECQKLCSLINEITAMKYTHFVTVGDLNFANINWGDMSTNRGPGDFSFEFVECIRDSFWYQHVHEPTRGRGDADPSLLDVIFSNEEGMINSVSIENPLGKSDHSVITFNFSGYSQNHHAKKRLNFA